MSLAEVRLHIERVDEGIVKLLAARQKLVTEAASYKADGKAAKHRDAMSARRRELAAAEGVSPDLVARVYEALEAGA
jgi:isochorismate pyruvate lyase